jgi:hypothetical protein
VTARFLRGLAKFNTASQNFDCYSLEGAFLSDLGSTAHIILHFARFKRRFTRHTFGFQALSKPIALFSICAHSFT